MKLSRGLGSVRIPSLCYLNWASKKCSMSIIGNNSFWNVGYLGCPGSNFPLWKEDGLLVSKIPCSILDPSPTLLASDISNVSSLDSMFQALKIRKQFRSSFHLSKS